MGQRSEKNKRRLKLKKDIQRNLLIYGDAFISKKEKRVLSQLEVAELEKKLAFQTGKSLMESEVIRHEFEKEENK